MWSHSWSHCSPNGATWQIAQKAGKSNDIFQKPPLPVSPVRTAGRCEPAGHPQGATPLSCYNFGRLVFPMVCAVCRSRNGENRLRCCAEKHPGAEAERNFPLPTFQLPECFIVFCGVVFDRPGDHVLFGNTGAIRSVFCGGILTLSTLGHTGANAASQRPGWAGCYPRS